MKGFLKSKAIQAAFLGLIGVFAIIYFQQQTTGNKVEIDESTLKNSPIVQNSPGTSIIYNEDKSIPYTKIFKTRIEFLRTLNKSLFNVKYVLPTGKEAFIPKITKGEEYTLFYTNDDISDIYVSEKYKFTDDLNSKVCWVATLICTNNSCGNYLELGPRGEMGDIPCFEL